MPLFTLASCSFAEMVIRQAAAALDWEHGGAEVTSRS